MVLIPSHLPVEEKERLLSECEGQLVEREQQLVDGQRQLADREQKLVDREQKLVDREQKLVDREQQLIDGKRQLSAREERVREAENDVKKREVALGAGAAAPKGTPVLPTPQSKSRGSTGNGRDVGKKGGVAKKKASAVNGVAKVGRSEPSMSVGPSSLQCLPPSRPLPLRQRAAASRPAHPPRRRRRLAAGTRSSRGSRPAEKR